MDMETTKCLTCQIQAKRDNGETVTQQESNHWMLWGCTCSPESAADAIDYMRKVTQ